MADLMSGVGGAEAGAGLGTAILPGVGTGVGAGLGFLGGLLFGKKKEVQPYVDPNQAENDILLNSLRAGTVGKDFASTISSANNRNAQLAYNRVANDPTMAGNTGARLNALDTLTRSAQEGNISGNVAGAKLNQDDLKLALTQGNLDRQFNYNNFRDTYQLNQQPSYLQQLGENGLSGLAGSVTGSLATKSGNYFGNGGNGDQANADSALDNFNSNTSDLLKQGVLGPGAPPQMQVGPQTPF